MSSPIETDDLERVMIKKLIKSIDENKNKIIVHDDETQALSSISIIGKSNIIDLGSNNLISGLQIIIKGSANKVLLGSGCSLNGRIVIKGHSQTVRIGSLTSFQSVSIFSNEGCDVSIGNDCMFSKKIEIRTSDSHSIIDKSTGLRVNAPGSVTIGDHVWVGLDTIISKGVNIPTDCIIGAKSFVNKSFYESSVLIAGVPARIIRSNLTWDRQLLNFENRIEKFG